MSLLTNHSANLILKAKISLFTHRYGTVPVVKQFKVLFYNKYLSSFKATVSRVWFGRKPILEFKGVARASMQMTFSCRSRRFSENPDSH
jgi:hypothetical protein